MIQDQPSYEALYDEWRSLIKQQNEINKRKREIKQQIKHVAPPANARPARKEKTLERANAMADLYKQGKTLEEIGESYGVTRERVRQVLKKVGVTSSDGGYSLRPRVRDKVCRVEGCDRQASTREYCTTHYSRLQRFGTPTPESLRTYRHDGCKVEGCDKPHVSNGLCNNHVTNFRYHISNGNVKDLDDFLKVQKAKQLIGKKRPSLEVIRGFMDAHKELFQPEVQHCQTSS